MNQQELDAVINEFLEKSVLIMKGKGDEYADNTDRLMNFRQVAQFNNMSMSQVCMLYMLKHVQALAKAARTGSFEWTWQTKVGGEGLKQRVSDTMNYAILFAACVEEESKKGVN